MDPLQAIASLWRTLKEQRIRTLSTLFGITWGTFSLVLLIAFGRGLERDLQVRSESLGRNLVIAWPQSTTVSHAGHPKGRRLRIRAQDIMKLPALIPELYAISAEYQNYETVQARGTLHSIRLSGVYPSFAELRTMIPQPDGRFFNPLDLEERRRVVFLGNQIKEDLFGPGPAVGQLLTLRGMPFTVIGVMKPKRQDSDYGGLDQDRIYLPATTHAQVFQRSYVSNFVFRARDLDQHDRVVNRVYAVLGRIYQFAPSDRAAINLWDTTESDRLIAYFFLGFNTILIGSGTLTLLIGGIGVANLMYIMVKQQSRELAIQIAIGARPDSVLRRVLGQATMIVLVGGAIGCGLASAIVIAVQDTSLAQEIGAPVLSPLLTLITVGFLGIVGVTAGYFPARRAAALDPAVVLAEE